MFWIWRNLQLWLAKRNVLYNEVLWIQTHSKLKIIEADQHQLPTSFPKYYEPKTQTILKYPEMLKIQEQIRLDKLYDQLKDC